MDKDLEDLKKIHKNIEDLRLNINKNTSIENLEKLTKLNEEFIEKLEKLNIKENE